MKDTSDLEDKLKNLDLPVVHSATSTAKRKEFLMHTFTENSQLSKNLIQRFVAWLKSGPAPKLEFSFGTLAVAIVLVFGISSFVTTPLTAQKVLAEAAAAYQQSPEGRYHYIKTRDTMIIDGEEQQITISEAWLDTQPNAYNTGPSRSKYQSTLEDDTVFTTSVEIDGEFYSYFNDKALQEQLEDTEIGPMPDLDPDTVIPGANAAGLSFDDFGVLSPQEIDQRLVDAGQDTYFDKIYGTTDFPGYTLRGDEVDFNQSDGLFPPEIAFYDGEKFVEIEDFFPEEPPINEEEIERESRIYEQIDAVSQGGTQQEREELIEQLQASDDITLIDGQEWFGHTVVGIQHSISPFEGQQTTSTTYFDAKTFRIVGSEHTSVSDGNEDNPIFAPAGTFTFRSVVLEESYSDEEPDFSTDGLIKESLLGAPGEGMFGEQGDFGAFTVRGLVTTEPPSTKRCGTSCYDGTDGIFFDISSGMSKALSFYLSDNKDSNSSIFEGGFLLGCIDQNSIISYDHYNDKQGQITHSFSESESATLLAAAENNSPIVIEAEKLLSSEDPAISACTSPFHSITIVD